VRLHSLYMAWPIPHSSSVCDPIRNCIWEGADPMTLLARNERCTCGTARLVAVMICALAGVEGARGSDGWRGSVLCAPYMWPSCDDSSKTSAHHWNCLDALPLHTLADNVSTSSASMAVELCPSPGVVHKGWVPYMIHHTSTPNVPPKSAQ